MKERDGTRLRPALSPRTATRQNARREGCEALVGTMGRSRWDNFPKRKTARPKPLAAIDLRKNDVGTGLVRLGGLGLSLVTLPVIYVI